MDENSNLYARFDALLEIDVRIWRWAAELYAEMSRRQPASVKYSTPADRIGLLMPPFFYGQTVPRSYRKGRAIKAPRDRTDYMEYLYDASGAPYLVRSFRNGGLDYAYVFTEEDGLTWAVPLMFDKGRPMSYEASRGLGTILYEYDPDGFLKRGGIIEGVSLHLEERRMEPDGRGTCDFWYYVSRLHGSDKSIPVERTGSPADLFRCELTVTDGVLTARFVEGWRHYNEAFRSMKGLRIAPQVHEVVLDDGTVVREFAEGEEPHK